jgi:hypothetical protein
MVIHYSGNYILDMKHRALTVIILFILLCGCGGVSHKKHRTAKPGIPPEVAEATYESQIRVLMSLWRTASLTKVGIDERLYGGQKAMGESKLNQLKMAAEAGPRALGQALEMFSYKQDPAGGKLDTITQPWATCVKMYGDCDDSAWLCAALMPGTIYDILEFKGTYKQGHLVFVTRDGYVFSNFELDGQIKDPRELGKKYNRNWTHIVTLSRDIQIESIMAR